MAKQDGTTPDQITIPEDLSTLSDQDLAELHDTAVAAFQAMLPEDGSAPDDETLDALNTLAEGVEALKGEVSTRDQAALSRSSKAKELADRVLQAGEVAVEVQAEEDEGEEGEEAPAEEEEAPAEDEALVAAAKQGKRAPININLGSLRKGSPAPKEEAVSGPKKIALAAQGAAGYDVGRPMTLRDMAESVNSRLSGFNASAYMNARKKGLRQSERFTIARLPREFDERAVVRDEDPTEAMAFATDESNLQGGSLVASGGWCSPSETLYDLAVDLSDDADLISVPEIQITRGGIRHTLGPDYRTVFADTGFTYTEQEDIDGDYDGAGGGTKPCQTVPCPGFDDVRLGYSGVCIGAGLLQQRGYPEVIEDYISKTLNAHAHRVSAAVINNMVADSEAIAFPAGQAGAVAPLLTAIDLQATHYRAVNRMARNSSLEVVLPSWTDVLVRADLARRLGVDLISVPDARINAWFAERQVNVQYVVDWQDIATTAASGFTAAPGEVDFLMYAAGTFVKGVSDSITLENIYDSVLLGTNDYTALFTEDPYLVAKRNHDSRVVTVPVAATGATHGGVVINADGTTGA